MSQENVELARRGFKLWNAAIDETDVEHSRAALDEMVAMYHPDAKIDYTAILPDFPSTTGKEAVRAWAEGARGLFATVRFEPLDFIPTGDAVVVPVRVSATSASGADVEMEVAYLYRFRGGKVSAANGFPTLSDALKAVGLEG